MHVAARATWATPSALDSAHTSAFVLPITPVPAADSAAVLGTSCAPSYASACAAPAGLFAC